MLWKQGSRDDLSTNGGFHTQSTMKHANSVDTSFSKDVLNSIAGTWVLPRTLVCVYMVYHCAFYPLHNSWHVICMSEYTTFIQLTSLFTYFCECHLRLLLPLSIHIYLAQGAIYLDVIKLLQSGNSLSFHCISFLKCNSPSTSKFIFKDHLEMSSSFLLSCQKLKAFFPKSFIMNFYQSIFKTETIILKAF